MLFRSAFEFEAGVAFALKPELGWLVLIRSVSLVICLRDEQEKRGLVRFLACLFHAMLARLH